MQYWLFKSEPETWSWADQMAKGAEGEPWNGVRNYQANNNMKAMALGDRGFFYHSVKEKSIVGTVEVIGGHRPDPTDASGRFGLVTIQAIAALNKPITLADVKGEERLREMVLANNSRLSVQPVSLSEWKIVLEMSGGVTECSP